METVVTEKKAKSTKSSSYGAIRVRKDTKRRVLAEVNRANKKDYGKKVSADAIIGLVLGLLTPEHIVRLQEASLSNADKLDRDYRAYTTQHGPMSRDEYLGKRLSGELLAVSKGSSEAKTT